MIPFGFFSRLPVDCRLSKVYFFYKKLSISKYRFPDIIRYLLKKILILLKIASENGLN